VLPVRFYLLILSKLIVVVTTHRGRLPQLIVGKSLQSEKKFKQKGAAKMHWKFQEEIV